MYDRKQQNYVKQWSSNFKKKWQKICADILKFVFWESMWVVWINYNLGFATVLRDQVFILFRNRMKKTVLLSNNYGSVWQAVLEKQHLLDENKGDL